MKQTILEALVHEPCAVLPGEARQLWCRCRYGLGILGGCPLETPFDELTHCTYILYSLADGEE